MTKKPIRKVVKMLLLPVIAAVLAFSGLFAAVVIQAGRLSAPVPADAIIVLGAQVGPDGAPSQALKRRLDLALSLYLEGFAPLIVTTGAQGGNEPMPEAYAMRDYLVANGVPETAVECDPDSYNTTQNIENAKALMDARGATSAIVVTSDYHLWRALSICGDFSIPASGAGSQNALTRRMILRNFAQETLSWVKYTLTRWL